MCEVRFGHQYSHTDAIKRLVGEANGIILDRFFGESVTLHLRLPIASARGFAAALADLTAGMIVLTNEDNGLPN